MMHIQKIEPDDTLYPAMLERFPSTARYIADPEDHGEYHFFAVVSPDGVVIGGAVIDVGAMGFGPLKDMTIGFLENIEVDEPYRRRGIGTALLRATLGYAWNRGAQNVRWTVDWADQVAVAFYLSAGASFIPEGDSIAAAETYYTLAAANPSLVAAGYGAAPRETAPL